MIAIRNGMKIAYYMVNMGANFDVMRANVCWPAIWYRDDAIRYQVSAAHCKVGV